MDEDEEMEVHFNSAVNTPDPPPVSPTNSPDQEDKILGETDYAVVLDMVNNLRNKLSDPSTWTILTFGLHVMLYADNAIAKTIISSYPARNS